MPKSYHSECENCNVETLLKKRYLHYEEGSFSLDFHTYYIYIYIYLPFQAHSANAIYLYSPALRVWARDILKRFSEATHYFPLKGCKHSGTHTTSVPSEVWKGCGGGGGGGMTSFLSLVFEMSTAFAQFA